jgi:deoxyribose-phosphate aldolase
MPFTALLMKNRMAPAHCIEHTLLKPQAVKNDLIALCNEAKKAGANRLGCSASVAIVQSNQSGS